MKLLTPLVAAALVAGAAFPVQAVPVVFTTTLLGSSEEPPTGSPGTGSGRVTLDEDAGTFRIETSFAGLLAATTAAHIHCCTAAVGIGNAGVATQVPVFVDFPLGVLSGSYDHVFGLLDEATYNPAFVTANGGTAAGAAAAFVAGIEGGVAYLNIHSAEFPMGEIRGFLAAPIPEPATAALMLGGLAALALAARRRR